MHFLAHSEENVYQLCKTLAATKQANLQDLFVVFISNGNKKVPIWHQRSSRNPLQPVVWDYHVLCVQQVCPMS